MEGPLRICLPDRHREHSTSKRGDPKPLLCIPEGYGWVHVVQRGESLSRIVENAYAIRSAVKLQEAVARVARDNPQLLNLNLVHPGQLILLPVELPQAGIRVVAASGDPMGATGVRESMRAADALWSRQLTPSQQAMAAELSPLMEYGATVGDIVAGGGLSGFESAVDRNAPLIREIAEGYEAYRSGRLTKGQYDYLRRAKLEKLQKNLGPMRHLLFGNRTLREVIRVGRGGGSAAVRPLLAQLSWLAQMTRLASAGGFVLSAASLGMACSQIAGEKSRMEKNQVAVEALTGTVVGGFAGFLAGIFLASNPVGWGVCLVIGLSVAGLGWLAGYVGQSAYTKLGASWDLVDALYIDRICS